jgi:hypothetical protein
MTVCPHGEVSVIRQPTLAANGDNDRIIYPDAGNGGIFQHHQEFVGTAIEFLDR